MAFRLFGKIIAPSTIAASGTFLYATKPDKDSFYDYLSRTIPNLNDPIIRALLPFSLDVEFKDYIFFRTVTIHDCQKTSQKIYFVGVCNNWYFPEQDVE